MAYEEMKEPGFRLEYLEKLDQIKGVPEHYAQYYASYFKRFEELVPNYHATYEVTKAVKLAESRLEDAQRYRRSKFEGLGETKDLSAKIERYKSEMKSTKLYTDEQIEKMATLYEDLCKIGVNLVITDGYRVFFDVIFTGTDAIYVSHTNFDIYCVNGDWICYDTSLVTLGELHDIKECDH